MPRLLEVPFAPAKTAKLNTFINYFLPKKDGSVELIMGAEIVGINYVSNAIVLDVHGCTCTQYTKEEYQKMVEV